MNYQNKQHLIQDVLETRMKLADLDRALDTGSFWALLDLSLSSVRVWERLSVKPGELRFDISDDDLNLKKVTGDHTKVDAYIYLKELAEKLGNTHE